MSFATSLSLLIIGVAFGIASTFFALAVSRLLKSDHPIRGLIRALILFMLSGGLITLVYYGALSGGLLEEWQSLGFPSPGERAVKILDIDYFQTQNGNIYHFLFWQSQDRKWERVTEVKRNQAAFRSFRSSPGNCATLPFLPFMRSDFIDSKSACLQELGGLTRIVYAIDEEGQVYVWQNSAGSGDVVPSWRVQDIVFVLGASAAALLGIIIVLLLVCSRFITSKIRRHNS